eukprot:7379181-Prymnesium_polylepis.1
MPHQSIPKFDLLTQKSPEDARRRARHDEKSQAQRHRQDTLEPADDRTSKPHGIIPTTAADMEYLPTDKPDGKYQDENNRPGHAQHNGLAVVAQARTCDEHVLQVGRHFEEMDPPGVLFQPQGRHNIVDARHRRDALVEAHQHLELEAHPCRLPH